MGVLTGKRCYLGGPIEHATSVDWRPPVKNSLSAKFGIDVFDPAADPKQQMVPQLKHARITKDLKAIKKVSEKFVRKDLGLVDRCDFLISCLPAGVPTTGCVHEIIDANERKKPTLLVCPDGAEHLPYWYFGFIRLKYMFGSFEELYEYLDKVNRGKCKKDDRWAFVYGLI